MSFWDFLKEGVHTPFSEHYLAAGIVFAIATNSESILAAARETFTPASEPKLSAQVAMRLWVDSEVQTGPPWPQPYFRGLDHLVFAGFDCASALLVDLRGRRVIGRCSPALAADLAYWTRIIFPALFGIVSASVGVTPLHCACAARNGGALLLAGAAGSGKSTLSLALAQKGFSFLSDDWTYFSRRDGQLLAWGLAKHLKLLPDTVEHFPELADLEPCVSLNGELAYEVDPEQLFGVRRSDHAEPRWLVFLERQENTAFTLIEMASAEAAWRLEQDLEDLPAVLSEARAFWEETVRNLADRQCWLLRYGGKPHAIAQALSHFCESLEG